jgi:hypothetical protein
MSDTAAALADGVLGPLARLLGEMQAAGVADPGRVVRAALAAGENAVKNPLLAWAAGVDPTAILWGHDVRTVLVVADVLGDRTATAHAIEVALDVAALAPIVSPDTLRGGGFRASAPGS